MNKLPGALKKIQMKRNRNYFMKRKTNGIIVLATARRHEHGERSTKYFFLI